MNRDDRKRGGREVRDLVQQSSGYMVLALVRGRMVLHGDVSGLNRDDDIGHCVMRSVFEENKELIDGVNRSKRQERERLEMAGKVLAAKEERSLELGRYLDGGGDTGE